MTCGNGNSVSACEEHVRNLRGTGRAGALHLPGHRGEKVAGPEGQQRQTSQGLVTSGTVRQELWEARSRGEAGDPLGSNRRLEGSKGQPQVSVPLWQWLFGGTVLPESVFLEQYFFFLFFFSFFLSQGAVCVTIPNPLTIYCS